MDNWSDTEFGSTIVPGQKAGGLLSSPWKIAIIAISFITVLCVGSVALGALLMMRGRAKPVSYSTPNPITEATLTVSPAEGYAGTLLTVKGEKWPPGEVIFVSLEDPIGGVEENFSYAGAVVDEAGNFSVTFNFPREERWTSLNEVNIVAWAEKSGLKVSAPFQVVPPTPTPSPLPETPTATPTETPTPVPPTFPPPPPPPVIPTPGQPAPVITDWLGEYFNNPYLQGNPVLVRNDVNVDFNWAYGSPGPGLPADYFSARWRRNWNFSPGNYRFYIQSDDGVRLWVGGQLIIDQWHEALPTVYVADLYLPGGTAGIQVEYFESLGMAYIRLWWERVEVFTDWKGEYFNNPYLQGNPVLLRNDVNVDFNWGMGSPGPGVPADNFSARWTRNLQFSGGTYHIYVQVDDGARLWVDGMLAIDQWHDGPPTTYATEVYLNEGPHSLRLEYYERVGGALVKLWWEKVEAYPDWKGEYFNNPYLQGSPFFTRNDPVIDFNWGDGSPGPGVPPDNFSVRWGRNFSFSAGQYRFYAHVDDGVRFWVDGQLIIDQWHEGGPTTYTGEIYLSGGPHALRMDYYERFGGAVAKLWWEKIDTITAWRGEYYNNRNLEGSPVLVRNDAAIDFDWGNGSPGPGVPADNFSVRWTRRLNFEAGFYRFYFRVDDGMRLWIDNLWIVDDWRDGQAVTQWVDVNLSGGAHDLRMDYYEHGGRAEARLWWEKVSPTATPTLPPPPPTSTPTNTPTSPPPPPTATPTSSPTPTETPTPSPTTPPGQPFISLNPNSGPVGTQINVQGDQWPAGSTVLLTLAQPGTEAAAMAQGEARAMARAQAGPDGHFEASIILPPEWEGQPQAIVVAYTSDLNYAAVAVFTIQPPTPTETPTLPPTETPTLPPTETPTNTPVPFIPIIQLEPSEGPVGMAITVHGAGWPANTQVLLTFAPPGGEAAAARGEISPLSATTTDGEGRFETSITLPPGQGWESQAQAIVVAYTIIQPPYSAVAVFTIIALPTETPTQTATPTETPVIPPPDSDGDGVPDNADMCPNEPGPAENNGCPPPTPTETPVPPDSDGDGVSDNADMCPNEPGPAENNGCPPPPTETPTETPPPPLLAPPISASIAISPTMGISGTVVVVNGQGWPPGQPVSIALMEPGAELSQAVDYVSTTVGSDGLFSTTFTFPPDARWWARAEVFVIAHSADWATIATATFTLSVPLSPTLFLQGESSYAPEAPSYKVFNTAEEWQAFLAGFGGAISPPPEIGPIWEEEILLGFFAGAQPTSGYTANITSVLRYGTQVRVYVQVIPPAPGAPVTEGTSYPYHLVKLRRAELMRGPASFIFSDELGNVLAQVDVLLP